MIIKFLLALDVYDYLKIFKERFFLSKIEKDKKAKMISFYSKFIKQGDLCFDVGANYGNRCEAFLSLNAIVVAFEPQPRPMKFLKRKFGNQIELVNSALGSKQGKGILNISSATTLSSLSEEWIDQVKKNRFKHAEWNKKIEIDITTLDSMIKKYGIPNFCKIDVEGYELEVLKGLSKPIKTLSFEYTIPEFIDKAVDCIEYLNSLGKIVCNYSSADSMELAYTEWKNPEEFIPLFRNIVNEGIIDGDIYIQFL